MSSILIRDVDPEVVKRLKELSRLHHRSLQGELRAILEEAAQRAPSSSESWRLDLKTVNTGRSDSLGREDIYGDDAR